VRLFESLTTTTSMAVLPFGVNGKSKDNVHTDHLPLLLRRGMRLKQSGLCLTHGLLCQL
jgi:hypothetical protein